MKEQAMDKLRDEMAKNPQHTGLAALGEYLTERLEKEPKISERILAEGKTLMGCFEKIKKYAKSIAKGGCAWVDHEKALEILCEYYGIPQPTAEAAAVPPPPHHRL